MGILFQLGAEAFDFSGNFSHKTCVFIFSVMIVKRLDCNLTTFIEDIYVGIAGN